MERTGTAFQRAEDLKTISPGGFEARSLLQQTIRYCEHYGVDLVFATDYDNSFIFHMPLELFKKSAPEIGGSTMKSNSSKDKTGVSDQPVRWRKQGVLPQILAPMVRWEHIPRESARLAFAYCLWHRVQTVEADIVRLTPGDVRP